MRKFLLWSLLSLLLLSAGCVNNGSDIIEATLTVNPESVDFDQEPGNKLVVVATNQMEWDFYTDASAEWLKATKTAEGLEIAVEANLGSDVRKSIVMISAGNIRQKVEVTQLGTAPIFEASISEAMFTVTGSSAIVNILTNSNESWTTELEPASAKDWVQLEINQDQRYVRISAENNEGNDERKATLYIRNSVKTLEVDITQAGSLSFVMPIDPLGMSWGKLVKAEEDRGHTTQYVTKKYISSENPNRWWDYLYAFTGSTLMPMIGYEYNVYNNAHSNDFYVYAEIVDVDASKLLDGKYQKFISKYGFGTLKQVDGASVYWATSKEHHLELEIVVDQQTNLARISFSPIPGQVKDQPTIAKLPLSALDLLNNGNVRFDQLVEKEKTAGYEVEYVSYSRNYPDQISGVMTANQSAPEVTHKYWSLATGEGYPGFPFSVLMALDNPEWGFFNQFYAWEITQEYIDLFKSEGFIYDGWSWNNPDQQSFKIHWFYKNVSGNMPHTIWIETYPVNYSDFAPNKTRLYINLYREFTQASSASLRSSVKRPTMQSNKHEVMVESKHNIGAYKHYEK